MSEFQSLTNIVPTFLYMVQVMNWRLKEEGVKHKETFVPSGIEIQ